MANALAGASGWYFPDLAAMWTAAEDGRVSPVVFGEESRLARDFYAEMCRIERWDVRTLRQKIADMLFQRTALSKNTEEVIASEIADLRDGRMTPDLVFRDPVFLDFLGLKGAFSEQDLEDAILREMEGVLLELGAGFAFVARQKRMSVGGDDFYLDLGKREKPRDRKYVARLTPQDVRRLVARRTHDTAVVMENYARRD